MTQAPSSNQRPVLVTGATGYVGGRLAPLLLARGHAVRAAGRSADKVLARPWATLPGCQAVALDVFDPDSLVRAMDGCQAAYYLVHSMSGGHAKDFAEKDRRAASNFAKAAEQAGVERILYLGGLGDENDPHLSEHLRSRIETGKALQAGPVDVTWLRAAVILGSGSASFEIIRYLVDRLPLMITPRWVRTKSQPIAIANVLGYLAGCLEVPETSGQTFDIGGPDILAYRDLFHLYAEAAGLRRRWIIPAPLMSPRLSAHWVNLITPVSMGLIRPLIEGLRNEAVCADNRIRELVPQKLLSCREAMRRAVTGTADGGPATCCYDAGDACLPEWASCGDADYAGGAVLGGRYEAVLDGEPAQVWQPVSRLGGDTGWYYGDWLWGLRGLMDKLAGGPGLRRGRRHPEEIRLGDALDFWRVVDVQENKRLLLKAEMKVPGEALLEFTIEPREHGGKQATALAMRSMFKPRGVAGLLYWWSTWPFHELIFRNMHRRMARAAGLRVLVPAKKVN